jgi:hypothetical protein
MTAGAGSRSATKRKYERAGPVKKTGGVVAAVVAVAGFAIGFRLLASALG